MNRLSTEGQLKDGTMDTEEELNKQLEDVVAEIDKAKRELKALRRHQAENTRGKPGARFITGKEWRTEADEAAKQLDTLEQREREIRSKLHSGDQ
jgi:flagellar biosynthesis chaperone FliJ